jgi:osmotically-inducible protein OsmY
VINIEKELRTTNPSSALRGPSPHFWGEGKRKEVLWEDSMKKQGCWVLLIASCLLTGCFTPLWTGASLLYDRHHVYKKLGDYQLAAKAGHALYQDDAFRQKGSSIDLVVFNGDILLVGHVPTLELRYLAAQRISDLTGYRRLINQVHVKDQPNHGVEDGWITAKIRGRMFADAEIDLHSFKIITSDCIVYLMGDVRPKQAIRVVSIASSTSGVKQVVKLFKYYNLSQKALADS